MLKEPLAVSHIKHMLLRHWGTTPGQNFIYTHLNRVIKKYLDMIYISGPGHGGRRWSPEPISRAPTAKLEEWMRSYRPAELFDESGRLKPELAALAPRGDKRMGANPNANGGLLLRDLRMPDFADYTVDVPQPGIEGIGDTHVLGKFLRDVAKLNAVPRNFRIFGPDETLSNGLEAVFEFTNGNGWLKHDHHAIRYGCAQRHGSLSLGDGHH